MYIIKFLKILLYLRDGNHSTSNPSSHPPCFLLSETWITKRVTTLDVGFVGLLSRTKHSPQRALLAASDLFPNCDPANEVYLLNCKFCYKGNYGGQKAQYLGWDLITTRKLYKSKSCSAWKHFNSGPNHSQPNGRCILLCSNYLLTRKEQILNQVGNKTFHTCPWPGCLELFSLCSLLPLQGVKPLYWACCLWIKLHLTLCSEQGNAAVPTSCLIVSVTGNLLNYPPTNCYFAPFTFLSRHRPPNTWSLFGDDLVGAKEIFNVTWYLDLHNCSL